MEGSLPPTAPAHDGVTPQLCGILIRVEDSDVVGLGLGRRLIDIPVYRVSRDQWVKEREEDFGRWAGPLTDRVRSLLLDRNGDFAYNQIVGWIQVVRAGSAGHVKGYYFGVSAKRIGRRFRQEKFAERGKVLECHFYRSERSVDIMGELRAALITQAQEHRILKNRYLDLEVFDSLAPALKAYELLGLD